MSIRRRRLCCTLANDSNECVVAGFGEDNGSLLHLNTRVGDTLLHMKGRRCWRMMCARCLEKVELRMVSCQEKTDMLE